MAATRLWALRPALAELRHYLVHVVAWSIADLDGRIRPDAGDVLEASLLRLGDHT